MEQPPKKNNPSPQWTQEFLLSQLSQLTAAAAAPALAPGSYHKAAAVLVSFDPESIEPFERSTSDDDDFDRLLADVTTIHDHQGRSASMLRSEVRKKTLASMATPQELTAALNANPVRPQTSLQNMFEAYIRGSAPDIPQQTLDELGATLQVIEWLPSGFPNLPKAEEVQRLVERESLLKPFRDLANENFTGRATELRDLRIYVDFLPSQSTLESIQRFLSWDEKPPRIIYGPGGMGKSALLSKFILDHIAPKDGSRAVPFVYLDFDRPSLAAEEPRTLLMEAARQLAIQATDLSTLSTLRQKWIAETTETSRPELADMVSDFGSAFRTSSLSDDPVLFVADTFEVVQYRGAEITGEVIGLLDSLRKEIPRLRAVISGRAPVNTPDYPTENVALNKLNVSDAAAYLTRQGISPALASKVAAQVGGSPLSLRLAIEVLKREGIGSGGIANLEVRDWLYRRLQDSLIQGQLYRRILDYIKDEDVRKLAYPGLVLRRITKELIKDVLAVPCGVKVNDDATARKLFQGLQQEVSLVTPADDGSLHHRPEVREAMLQLMRRDEPVKLRSIQTAAVNYYRNNTKTDAEKAELLYHLAALGSQRSELENTWEPGLEKYLGGILPELPPTSRAFLAPLIHEPLDEEARKFLAHEDSERAAAQHARNFLLLERPEHALQALALPFPDASAVVLMLRAASFVQLGRWTEARDAVDAAFLTAHEATDPRLILKLEVLEARVLAQTTRRIKLPMSEESRHLLRTALLLAFPTLNALQSLTTALRQQLQDVSRATSAESAVLDLIRWTEDSNLLEELIGAAIRLNPGNAALNQVADSAGVDRSPTPSPARSSLPGEGLSYGRRLFDRYDGLIKKFLDDPRLLRVGLYFLERYRKRGAEEPRRREQLENLIIQLFHRIPATDLVGFGPLCFEVAGRLSPRKPDLLAVVLARFGMPELLPADRARLNEVIADWDKVMDGGIGAVGGTSWQQVVLKGDPVRMARMVQELFEKFGYFPALTEAVASKMLAVTSNLPEKTLFEELERVSQFWTDASQLAASLAEALNKFNWTEANSICNSVIARCREAALPFPAAPARQMLTSLRRKRQFAVMEMLGAAFSASMPENAQVNMLYAQALADEGKLVEAEEVLKDVLARDPSPADEAEVKGLIGRIKKQQYIDAPTAPDASDHLLSAIRIYFEVYRSNPKLNLWHGINSVALIARAERDRLPVFEFPDSRSLAQEILSSASSKRDLYAWDYATMAEAAIAIGDYRLAQADLNRYISDPSSDAFELGSTLRQFRQVWQLSTEQEPGASLLPLLQATLLRRQGGFLEPTSKEIASAVADNPFNRKPESVSSSFQQLDWYRTALLRAASVARIELPAGSPRGTGFLVKAADFFRGAPDRTMCLLTAAHVIAPSESSEALPVQGAIAVFEAGSKSSRLGRVLWISPANQLDAAFLSADDLSTDAAYCPMPLEQRSIDRVPQQRVYVIGYPGAGGLTFSLQDGLLLDSDGTRLHYRTPTTPGSAGSPVFDGSNWTLLALHHARNSRMPMLNNKLGFYEAGEGISVSAIQAATLASPVKVG